MHHQPCFYPFTVNFSSAYILFILFSSYLSFFFLRIFSFFSSSISSSPFLALHMWNRWHGFLFSSCFIIINFFPYVLEGMWFVWFYWCMTLILFLKRFIFRIDKLSVVFSLFSWMSLISVELLLSYYVKDEKLRWGRWIR